MSRIYKTLGTVSVTPKGEYDSSAYYEYLNIVDYEGSSYVAKQESHGILPTNTTYWLYLGGGVKISDTVLIFNNVADMKASNKLKNGFTAQTLGYYSANDGGAATYKITDEESETDYQEELENGLYATLIINDCINVKQFGAYGDNVHDDTQVINYVLQKYKSIYLPEGNYKVAIDYNPSTMQSTIRGAGRKTILYPNGTADYIIRIGAEQANGAHRYMSIQNLKIDGNYNNVDGLIIQGIQFGYVDNVYIHRCYKRGLYLHGAWDINFNNLDILGCGSLENHYYAIEMDNISALNINTNAIKIVNSHVEITPLILYTHGNVTQIEITNVKIEKGALNTDSTYRPFKMTSTNGLSINNSILTQNDNSENSVVDSEDDTLGLAFMDISGTVSINACNFFVAPGQKAVWFKGSGVAFNNCYFQRTYANNSTYPFYCTGYVTIANCIFELTGNNKCVYFYSGYNSISKTFFKQLDNELYSNPIIFITNTAKGDIDFMIDIGKFDTSKYLVGTNVAASGHSNYNYVNAPINNNITSVTITANSQAINSKFIILDGTGLEVARYTSEGQIYTIMALQNSTIYASGNIITPTGSNYTLQAGKVLQFISHEGYLYPIEETVQVQ